MQIAILGRQSKLGLVELESLAGAQNVRPIGREAAEVNGSVDGNRLGGVMRLAQPVHEVNSHNWDRLVGSVLDYLPEQLSHEPEGKLRLGISVIGFNANSRQLFALGLELKKACRALGRSVRVIPNTAAELNSAQVLHNGLARPGGYELLIIKDDSSTRLARTTWIQDIEAYAARDFGRPKRDAFVGMLPPKLAQTMLNLANVQSGERVLDPFCGTGVVLQEALLLGAQAYGTDISEKMVDYSGANLQWLSQKYGTPTAPIELGDATSHRWQQPINHIVCETYLGQPLSGLPKPEKLSEIIRDCNTIITKFLKNAHKQLAPGTRCTIAVPAWRVNNQFKHLELLDHLEDLGYNRVRFQHANDSSLIYHREDQIVARQLLVLISK